MQRCRALKGEGSVWLPISQFFGICKNLFLIGALAGIPKDGKTSSADSQKAIKYLSAQDIPQPQGFQEMPEPPRYRCYLFIGCQNQT